MSEKRLMSDEELLAKMREVAASVQGQGDDLCLVLGAIIAGRIYGWRVVRLWVPRRIWALGNTWFGDLKTFMPAETELSKRSLGFRLAKKAGDYWAFFQGRDSMPLDQRKAFGEAG